VISLIAECGPWPRPGKAAGLDVIVTDHHEPGPQLPPAVAVVNPKRDDDVYPFKELSGVGLAYKVAQAAAAGALPGWIDNEALAYVAVGTIADVASLTDENRVLVAAGWTGCEFPPPGLAALMEVGGINRHRLRRARGLLITRLNAAGRLGSATDAFASSRPGSWRKHCRSPSDSIAPIVSARTGRGCCCSRRKRLAEAGEILR
jgi:single-stranded DNA-specific DHH superfamily exonuclease